VKKKTDQKKRISRKRGYLEKDSLLDKFDVDLSEIDLYQLVDRSYLTMFCTLLYYRYSIKLEALADSRTNGFVFIDTLCAIDFVKFLSIKAQRLSQAISVKGYNRKNRSTITYIL
jgi:hypothetical protein